MNIGDVPGRPFMKLDAITTKIGSGATPRGGKKSYQDSGISLIRSLNVYDLCFQYEGLAFIDQEQAAKLSNVEVQPEDVLLNITGASVARCCMVPPDVLPARVNQHVSIIRVNSSLADPYYVLYCLNSPQYKHHFLTLAQGGATRQALTKKTIGNFKIPLPSLSTQRKIAGILSAYDDLIENNTRRIQILEEMAQAIYREWFVHFRFPGHEGVEMVESALGLVPAGWEVEKVGDVVKRLRAGKRYKQKEVAETGNVPVISQSQDEFLGFHDNDPDHQATPEEPIIIFGDHTCKMQLMIQPFSLGPNVVPFVSEDAMSVQYLFFSTRNLVETREYKRHWRELTSKKIIVAPAYLTAKFAALISPMFEQMDVLQKKNLVLRQTRDLLLPKLVSGEVDVSEVDVCTNASDSKFSVE